MELNGGIKTENSLNNNSILRKKLMDYVKEQRLRELERNIRFQCPKCGALGRFFVAGHDGFVYTRCPEYTVKCEACGHFYGVRDMESG